MPSTTTDQDHGENAPNERPFFPGGAILFFALLIVLYGAIWFAVYWVMVSRS